MRPTLCLAAAVLMLTLGACAEGKYDKDPLYDEGFSDGCSTGTARSSGTPAQKAVRDDELWSQSDAYRAGWKQGYAACAPNTHGDRDTGGDIGRH